jgi:hypothetical protein
MKRVLMWVSCILVAAGGWTGLVFFTQQIPPSQLAYFIFLPLLGISITATAMPIVWLVARALHVDGMGDRPVLALRTAGWVGLWSAISAGLKLSGIFDWVTVGTLAVVLGLLESFLLQLGRSSYAEPTSKTKSGAPEA